MVFLTKMHPDFSEMVILRNGPERWTLEMDLEMDIVMDMGDGHGIWT